MNISLEVSNHGLNSHLCIILAFLSFKFGEHKDDKNHGTVKTGALYSKDYQIIKNFLCIKLLNANETLAKV